MTDVVIEPGPNRRDGDRHPIELQVEYGRLNTFFADYTKNISKGGTFIRTLTPLELGTEFVFALTIPQLPEPLRLRGRVMWVIPDTDQTAANPAGMGIRFEYATDQHRLETEGVIEQLMSTSLGERISSRLLGRKPQGCE